MRRRAAFLDELSGFFAAHGMPSLAGRILAQLLICDPPEQSFAQLCAGVGASRASVSTMTRLLGQLGLVERRSGRGRTLQYRLRDDAWTRLLEDDLRSAIRLRTLAANGLALMRGRPTGQRRRLTSMRAFYTFLAKKTDAMLGELAAPMTFADKWFYHQIHPLKLATDIASSAVSCALVWRHQLALAALIAFVPSLVASGALMALGNLDRLAAGRFGHYVRRTMTHVLELQRMTGQVVMWAGAWYREPIFIGLGAIVIISAWCSGIGRAR